MDRFTAAHGKIHLMLLGSPPDMVHGIPSHRTRPFAHADTFRFNIIYYFLIFYKCYVKIFKTDAKRVEEHRKFWYNIID